MAWVDPFTCSTRPARDASAGAVCSARTPPRAPPPPARITATGQRGSSGPASTAWRAEAAQESTSAEAHLLWTGAPKAQRFSVPGAPSSPMASPSGVPEKGLNRPTPAPQAASFETLEN